MYAAVKCKVKNARVALQPSLVPHRDKSRFGSKTSTDRAENGLQFLTDILSYAVVFRAGLDCAADHDAGRITGRLSKSSS